MPSKKVPIRSCVACGLRAPKRELVRLVRTPGGDIEVDPMGKKAGRGAYLCARVECWHAAAKGDRLNQALRGPLTAADKEKVLAFWQQVAKGGVGRKEGS